MKKKFVAIDYLHKYQDEELGYRTFNEADVVLFALLCLIDTKNTMPKEDSGEARTLEEIIDKHVGLHGINKLGALLPLNITKFIYEACKSDRYKNIKIHDLHIKISQKLETQSTFMIADLSEKTKLILFGSTDDNVIAWKEDLNLLKSHDVECLKEASEYVLKHCSNDERYIFIGHSKGGMESAYTFLTMPKDLQDRVIVAYDLDGPGFEKEFIEQYKNDPSLDRLKLICPQGSMVGRLFYQPVKSIVCKSAEHGLMQHNPNSWVIKGAHFKRGNQFSRLATIRSAAINNYMDSLSDRDASRIVNGIMKIAGSGHIKTLTFLFKHPCRIFKGMKELNKAEKKALRKIPINLLKEGIKEIRK